LFTWDISEAADSSAIGVDLAGRVICNQWSYMTFTSAVPVIIGAQAMGDCLPGVLAVAIWGEQECGIRRRQHQEIGGRRWDTHPDFCPRVWLCCAHAYLTNENRP